MILIGSRALSIWHDEHTERSSSDWDVIVTLQEAETILGDIDITKSSWKYGDIELHNYFVVNNLDIPRLYCTAKQISIPYGLKAYVCSSRGLAAIKRGHLHRSLNFAKHIIQYQYLDREFDSSDMLFIEERKRLTKEQFPERIGSKDKNNEDFFEDAVVRVFKHDDLHYAITDSPMFLSLKRDKEKAGYDNDLWLSASHADKIRAIIEECYVIALERFLVPYKLKGKNFSYRIAYYKALEKACTTLDDGPFREYAIDHWSELTKFDEQIFTKFWNSKLYEHFKENSD